MVDSSPACWAQIVPQTKTSQVNPAPGPSGMIGT